MYFVYAMPHAQVLASIFRIRAWPLYSGHVSSSRTLQIQRFFKYFEVWIRELEEMSPNLSSAVESTDMPLASEAVDEHGVDVT
jgi:hypothetical protein